MSARANRDFKLAYRKYLDVSIVFSLALHLAAFAVMPSRPVDVFLVSEAVPVMIVLPEAITPPPPPPPVSRPEVSLDEPDDVPSDEAFDSSLDLSEPSPPQSPSPLNRAAFRVFDRPPVVRFSVPAEYPGVAREAGLSGTVRLLIDVDEAGRVIRAAVVESVAQGIFDQAALDAVRKWTFVPAEQSGHPVRSTIVISIEFSLSGS